MSLYNPPFTDKYTEFYGIIASDIDVTTLDAQTITATTMDVGIASIDFLTVDNQATIEDEIVNTSTITDLTVENEALIEGNATSADAVSAMLVEEGTHTWSAGQAPGANTLTISGLDGNNERDYKLYIDYIANPDAASNALGMTFNNDTSNLYAYDVFTGYTSAQAFSAQGGLLFLYMVGTGTFRGAMDCTLQLGKVINNYVYGFTTYTQQTGTGVPAIRTSNLAYNAGDSTTISSIEIDVTDNNHSAWQIYYRLIRMR